MKPKCYLLKVKVKVKIFSLDIALISCINFITGRYPQIHVSVCLTFIEKEYHLYLRS